MRRAKEHRDVECIRSFGRDDLARVYVLRLRPGEGGMVECVESLNPGVPRSEKWVLLVSTLFGCPVGCPMCDAGGVRYGGVLTAEEILEQVRFLVRRRFGGTAVPVRKFKIQFARMGEPALNPAVLDVLDRLPEALDAPGLLPSLSTIAPAASEPFFRRLLEIKERCYGGGRFQLQFSLHTTEPSVRARLVPVRCLDFAWMGRYGARFRRTGDQRITLNFAAAEGVPVEPERLLPFFDPEHFLVKLTPVNPTFRGRAAGMRSAIDPYRPGTARILVERFEAAGYRVILSIGAVEENRIGSNCGQYVTALEGDRDSSGFSLP